MKKNIDQKNANQQEKNSYISTLAWMTSEQFKKEMNCIREMKKCKLKWMTGRTRDVLTGAETLMRFVLPFIFSPSIKSKRSQSGVFMHQRLAPVEIKEILSK